MILINITEIKPDDMYCSLLFTVFDIPRGSTFSPLVSSGKGYFMHFSTASAEAGDRALLESQWLYPKPGAQCLQFFLHNGGATDDILNIWVREYDKAKPSSKLRLFKSISGNQYY